MSKSKFIFNNLGVIVGVLAMFSLIAYADSWQAPTANPPGNNVSAPVNVGGSDQIKLGGLGVGPLAVFGDILVSNVYKQGGAGNIKTGISLNCPGQTLGDLTLSGGIITGGTCASGGGAVPIQMDAQTSGTGKVTCPSGKKIIGGGCSFQSSAGGSTSGTVNACKLAETYPKYTDNSWNCTWRTATNAACGNSGETHTWAVCL